MRPRHALTELADEEHTTKHRRDEHRAVYEEEPRICGLLINCQHDHSYVRWTVEKPALEVDRLMEHLEATPSLRTLAAGHALGSQATMSRALWRAGQGRAEASAVGRGEGR